MIIEEVKATELLDLSNSSVNFDCFNYYGVLRLQTPQTSTPTNLPPAESRKFEVSASPLLFTFRELSFFPYAFHPSLVGLGI